MKKKLLIILAMIVIVIVFIVWMFGGIIKFYLPSSRDKATQVAKGYVMGNFEQDMECLEVRTTFEPAVYKVYFSPKNNSKLAFSVDISPQFIVQGDNYYDKYFEYQMENLFLYEAKNLWENEVSIIIRIDSRRLNADSPNLNQQIDVADAKEYLGNYWFHVGIKKVLMSEEKQIESKRILHFIEFIKNEGYNPYNISFDYLKSDSDKNDYYQIENWKEITSIEQILEYLDSK